MLRRRRGARGVTRHARYPTIGWVEWHDEPDRWDPFCDLDEYPVSFRPGHGAIPTEGDVARWMRWQRDASPIDWLIADGTQFRSMRAVAQALTRHAPMPATQTILGDWNPPGRSFLATRDAIRRDWAATKARNAADLDARRRAASQRQVD